MPDSSTFATWLTNYLVVGALVLFGMHLHGRLRPKTFAQQLALIIEREQAKQLSPKQQKMRRFMKYGVMLPFAWMNWPLMVVFKLWYEYKQFQSKSSDEPQDRAQRHTVDEIESNHRQTDPQTGQTGLPFGQLNHRWETFKRHLQSGDEIWSFRSPGPALGIEASTVDGYVIVRHRKSVAFFWVSAD